MSDCTDDADAVDEALQAAATGPRRVQGDAGSVESHSLKDLIEVDRYRRAKCAGKTPRRGLTITKLIPPGTT